MTVTTSPLHRGEHEVSRKAVAQGMSECFRSPVCSCAPTVQFLAHETAGAACTRHSLRPLLRGRQRICITRAKTRREIADARSPHVVPAKAGTHTPRRMLFGN